jgi:hypothetical protein
MLTEDQINLAVKSFLEGRGWMNVVALAGNAHGVDVEGVHPTDSRTVQVESKGGTSGRRGTGKFGEPCASSQVRAHVARAVFTAIRLREKAPSSTVLIALPGDDAHLSAARSVSQSLEALGIVLLAVTDSGVDIVFGEASPR